ncbi:hypothetical protein OY671_012107, partial [Metschnikowia pulcherrima]
VRPGAQHPACRHRRIGAGAGPAGRCAGPRGQPLRRRDRLQCRWRRAGGCVPPLRSRDHAAGRRLQDLHHHRDDAERAVRAAMDDRGGGRGPLWQGDRADRLARQGGGMGRRRDPHPALFRKRRRTLFAVVDDRLPGGDRARSGPVRGIAGGGRG